MKKAISNAFILLLFTLMSLSGFSQATSGKKVVTGTVLDNAQIPLPGVTVLEKGTNNGAVTDFDGAYSINVTSKSTIVFTYVGMKSQEKAVGDLTTINVTLQEDTQSLDEVIVVGYGAQKKEAVTAAIESIKGEELEDLPVGNIATALVGRVLGVGVSGGDTRPGQPARLTIREPLLSSTSRGKYALALGADGPLYVIDGVVQIDPNTGFSDPTYFNTLDASQIESISFLKDAAAAIYGSRAAQGVVLVTTKQGRVGSAKLSYSGNYSIADAAYETKMLNAYQYGMVFNIMNSINPENNIGSTYDPSNPIPDNRYFFSPIELEHFKTLNYNSLDQYWSAATTQRHNLNYSGGNDNATYFGGISYYTQDGNLGSLDYDRWSFRAGSGVKLAKGLKTDFQVFGYFTDVSSTSAGGFGGDSGEHDYRQLINRTPFMPMYVDGLPAMLNGATNSLFYFHYGELLNNNNISKTSDNSVGVNISADYDVPFLKGLKFKINYSRQERNMRAKQLANKYSVYEFFGADSDLTDSNPQDPGQTYVIYESGSGALGINNIKRENLVDGNFNDNRDRILLDYGKYKNEQTRFQAAYDNDFGKHSVSALFAVEKSERFLDELRVGKYGLPDWSTEGILWQASGPILDPFEKRAESGDLGYIGRLNYDYDNKYFGEFLFRSDASAKFAPENYWGTFYSVSGGWIISREDFFKSNFIDFLKFRASVGLTGNDDIRPWKWLQNFQLRVNEGAVFGGNLGISDGLRDSGSANRSARWSEEIKTNYGLEAKILDNRLSLTVENFYNIATGVLLDLTTGVPFTVGGTTAPSNAGRWDRWGMEVGLGWDDTIGDDFSYGIRLNTGWYQAKIIDGNFSNEDDWYPWNPNKPGNPDVGVWGYDYMGMFRTQEDIDNYIAQTGVTRIINVDAENFQPGMLYYRDIRGPWDPETKTFAEKDGIVDGNDRIQLQKPAKGPQGFSSVIDFKYKNLSFNTVLTVNWGGYREVGSAKNLFDSYGIGGNYENRPAFWANMYHPTLNPNGTIPNLTSSNINNDTAEGGNSARADGGINTVSSKFWQVSSFNLLMRNINIGYSFPKSITESLGIDNFRLSFVALNPFILYNPYKDYGLPPSGSYNSYPVLQTYSLGLNVGF